MATWNIDAERKGPGLLLRDIQRGDPQIEAAAAIAARIAPDILLLQGVDYDHDLLALRALRDRFAAAGIAYPHLFALRPNTGWPTGQDIDGDGRTGEPEDAVGYGRFSGQGGMALLSRYPIDRAGARDLSAVPWAALPAALLSDDERQPLLLRGAEASFPLASVAHWIVPLDTPQGKVSLLALHAGPPVFDGPDDRNGRRNHDQIMFWIEVLNGSFGAVPTERFVVIGDTNQDPQRGEGRKSAIRALLSDPRLTDPRPVRSEAEGVARADLHATVAWPETDLPPMRVDYILPSRDWRVVDAGVYWPRAGDPAAEAALASGHRLVWVDLAR
ncbi:endonuclease/exonuclease/phosphatase family protein [Roseovarius sp. SCSIO 43702]|uniref:endonuclease/exonuclease/phosphatase family protein n=1 Tax=Roseovarius sp. SCSIO 43702 TaxID=2823043 RepID=UPI002175CF5F|nr:endonuclease/exonuclease/phosphatase family protein [Roseovarius sp. SCSIO 43702]